MRFWFKFFYALAFPIKLLIFPCRVTGKENIPDGAAIVCVNHTSLMDPIMIAYAFGRNCRLYFMAKAELFSVPVLKTLFRSLGAYPISRGETDIASIRTSMKHLKNGDMVLMFPEGTRVSPQQSVDAKTGAVRIAAKTNVPILPIHLTSGQKMFRISRIVIGCPYFVEPPTDKNFDKLTGKLMDSIFALEPKQ